MAVLSVRWAMSFEPLTRQRFLRQTAAFFGAALGGSFWAAAADAKKKPKPKPKPKPKKQASIEAPVAH